MSKKNDISEKKNQKKQSKSENVKNILPFELKSLKKQNILIVLFWKCHVIDWFWV